MKAKVAHLFKKLEEIERDGVELKKLTDRIAEDREYSPILRESFQAEMHKLEEQKSEILKISISQIPDSLSGKLDRSPKGNFTSSPETETPSSSDKKKTDKPVRKY
ncbi:hypothetical protein LPTSP3_g18030 [Leptospira kobayashii]|uniref:Uncharacterized protein n=1 Tax=Leptospira kobayashii TaxID=1917830 RepID=A0ABN6KGJ4_9LEPT|nr:hypothetical protein [Leptospira kobayashii]BDA78873.1 hypothetical protein LPTSP3_g18030 [Leptospira kobayashii]